MIRLLHGQPKWLAGLIILVVITLLVGGCTPANQPPVSPPPVNQPPVISSLTANTEQVNPSGSYQVKCVASDPDGDKLSYAWSASGGSISGEDSEITWIPPVATGDYTIMVKVTDGRGGEATAQLTINVAVNHPPVIESLTAEPQAIKKAMTSTIKCIAADPDGDKLSYTWFATGGRISGEGPVATWLPPDAFGTYTITVTVTDARGGQDTETVNIVVTCCPKTPTEYAK